MTKQPTILFLEDEKEYLTTISELLRERGYIVIEKNSAEDALISIGEMRPDLIVADIKLPGADGFDFFEQVKKNEKCKDVPFIFLTAYNNMEASIYAKKHGAADYITKPFDFEYLITRILQITPL